jgi:AhpD family alkylhydroperoxidase
MEKFIRRFYHNPGEFFEDLVAIISHRSQVRPAMRGGGISPAFRERLMLVVTQVNDCRYCRSFHTRLALSEGVPSEELNDLLTGYIPEDCPEAELQALLYAQHWAEMDSRPDPEATQKLVETYGEETADAVQLVLLMIRMGNLAGNSIDYILYRLSFGKLGRTNNRRIKPSKSNIHSSL